MTDAPVPGPDAFAPQPGPAAPDGPGKPAAPPLGAGLAVAALVLGLLSCVLPFLPVNLDLVRHYVAVPSALGGLVLAVGSFTGNRRGKPLAVAGAVLCALALVLTMIMIVNGSA